MSGIKKRIQLFFISSCCILLSGCSGTKTSPCSSTEAKKTALSVSWFGDDVRNEYMLQTLGSFTQQYPDIHLSMNYTIPESYPALYDTRNAASMDSDVLQISYEQFCDADLEKSFYPLSDIKDYLNLHLLSAQSLAWCTKDDTLYALSNSIDLPAFYYNEDFLQSLGSDVPATWDDLFALADSCFAQNKSSDSGTIYPLAMTRTDLFELLNAWIEQTSGSTMFDESNALQYTEVQLAKLLSFYQRLIQEHIVLIADEPAFAISSGQAVGCFAHASYASSLSLACDGTAFTLSCGPLLTSGQKPEHPGWYLRPGLLYAVSSSAAQPREAAKLLRFLVSSDTAVTNQGLSEGYPSTSGAYQKLHSEDSLSGLSLAACTPFLEDRDSFSLLSSRLASAAVRDYFFSAAAEMLGQDGDPEEFATKLRVALEPLS